MRQGPLIDMRAQMTPFEQVQQAFLQFCWAIKLDTYLSVYPPANKVDFDNSQLILDPRDTFSLPGDQLETVEDIHLGAENSVLLSVGALFLAFDTALDEAGIGNHPCALDAFGQLRILVYMCRCAFAHNVLAPRWEVRGKYCRQLTIELPDISIQVDLNELGGKPFTIQQIGGYSQLIKINECIAQRLVDQ